MSEWTKDEVDMLVTLWNNGTPRKQIAEELDKSHGSVKMYLQRHKRELNLAPRINNKARPTSGRIDKEWYGVIPLGHWSITKPWGKKCAVKPVTKY
jgi:hypothetical protein